MWAHGWVLLLFWVHITFLHSELTHFMYIYIYIMSTKFTFIRFHLTVSLFYLSPSTIIIASVFHEILGRALKATVQISILRSTSHLTSTLSSLFFPLSMWPSHLVLCFYILPPPTLSNTGNLCWKTHCVSLHFKESIKQQNKYGIEKVAERTKANLIGMAG